MIGPLDPELHASAAPAATGRWMQVLSHMDPKYGGISTVVPSLVEALSRQGTQSSMDAFCAEGEEYRPPLLPSESVHFWPIQRLRWWKDAAMRMRFDEETRRHDGLHIHGLWDVTSMAASRAGRRRERPYVLSSHGMLEPWALNHGRLKKRLYSFAIERDVVRGAACLHALTEAETLQYREYAGKRIPTVVIPNGVTVPKDQCPEHFLNRYPELRGRRIVLFLARLHRKKGVDLLLQSWRKVIAVVPEAVLVLAGPDSNNLSASLQELAISDGVTHNVVFPGMLEPEAKWSALAAAECFILPSHSEGLSMSVLEALGAGVPVVVTPQCNMPWIPEAGVGWLTDTNPSAIAESLIAVLGRGREQNARTGRLGSEVVRRNYSWTSVAERMAEVYQWCLGGNEPVLSEVLR